ncbi:MAG: HypC/HybG/HupF family hydrogenase formation chaperone [Fidelibacterota bacterium]|nr:MAG: HypC/HybG/HupF family hydrogenase formation chaperone [Candidatus Neomarinimicrobiota bacterium]
MCLAIPGKVVEIFEEAGLTMGRIDYGGVINKACLAYLPEIQVGDYAIVHAGFAISILDEEAAQASFEAWEEMIRKAREAGITLDEEGLIPGGTLP